MLFQKTVFLVAPLIHLKSTSRQHWSRRRLESTILDNRRYMALACVYLCHLCFTVVASVNSVNLLTLHCTSMFLSGVTLVYNAI